MLGTCSSPGPNLRSMKARVYTEHPLARSSGPHGGGIHAQGDRGSTAHRGAAARGGGLRRAWARFHARSAPRGLCTSVLALRPRDGLCIWAGSPGPWPSSQHRRALHRTLIGRPHCPGAPLVRWRIATDAGRRLRPEDPRASDEEASSKPSRPLGCRSFRGVDLQSSIDIRSGACRRRWSREQLQQLPTGVLALVARPLARRGRHHAQRTRPPEPQCLTAASTARVHKRQRRRQRMRRWY